MEVEDQEVYSKFRKLISESCMFTDTPSLRFRSFHHEFLKFFFGVMKVKINYQEKSIEFWSPKPIDSTPLTSYNIHSCVTGTVSYLDFEATLLGCMEEGKLQIRFYKHLLHEYGPESTLFENEYVDSKIT